MSLLIEDNTGHAFQGLMSREALWTLRQDRERRSVDSKSSVPQIHCCKKTQFIRNSANETKGEGTPTQIYPRQTGHRRARTLAQFLFLLILPAWSATAQTQDAPEKEQDSSHFSRGIGYLFNYLNMAGTTKARQFHPMTQQERTHLYLQTMINPLGFIKAGLSAGFDQWADKPKEWEQGASGYGKRYANILGQYSIQRTVTFGLSSLLHEDNRYFNSGKKGVWPRLGYSFASGVLARHDDGSRHISISQLGGVAAGAFLSRTWLPRSQSSAGDAAVSFGITMGSNIGFGVLKEFLPDLGRAIAGDKHKKSKNAQARSGRH